MMNVELTDAAAEEFRDLPVVIQKRVRKIIRRLEDWPTVSGVRALSGNLVGWYRIRTGDYRVRFRPEEDAIIVDKIGHRKDVYED
jgi:mRNA interferase RelE/StbE